MYCGFFNVVKSLGEREPGSRQRLRSGLRSQKTIAPRSLRSARTSGLQHGTVAFQNLDLRKSDRDGQRERRGILQFQVLSDTLLEKAM